jgi:twinkle protein
MIVHPDDLVFDIKRLYSDGGMPPGDSTGFKGLDPLYTIARSQWTVVTGYPGSGKSEFVDAMMVNLAKTGKWSFGIYSPENWPLKLHVAHIIEKYTGKPFNPGPTQRLNEDELDQALAWMQGKFYFAKPQRPNMASILEEADKFTAPGSERRFGVVVDPWNTLEHHRPHGISETEYISQTLSWVIDWVRNTECHLWLTAHPAKMQKQKDGTLPVPTPHDISGSAHFWNKSDNALCVHRNQGEGSSQVEIHVQKVRFRNIGRVGRADLIYDKVSGQYRDLPTNQKFTYADS